MKKKGGKFLTRFRQNSGDQFLSSRNLGQLETRRPLFHLGAGGEVNGTRRKGACVCVCVCVCPSLPLFLSFLSLSFLSLSLSHTHTHNTHTHTHPQRSKQKLTFRVEFCDMNMVAGTLAQRDVTSEFGEPYAPGPRPESLLGTVSLVKGRDLKKKSRKINTVNK